MIFPQEEGNEIATWIVRVVDSIFEGIGKEEEAKNNYSLALIILADIYQSLRADSHFSKGVTFCFSSGRLNIFVKKMAPNNKSCQRQPRRVPLTITSFI